MTINYRLATERDLFHIMRLHQLTNRDPAQDGMMVNWHRLRESVTSGTDFWCVGETDQIVAAVSVMQDENEAIAKIHRIYVAPSEKEPDAIATGLLTFLLEHLEKRHDLDLIYTTTWKQSMHLIDLAEQLGFIMMGTFPNPVSDDVSKVNGIACYFMGDALGRRRTPPPALHPLAKPFFDIVRLEASLDEVETREPRPLIGMDEPVPHLELIDAPRFVARRFAKLQSRRSLTASFYPFQQPDCVITGPDQEIEVFVRGIPELRFAMIIGERFDRQVDVVELYTQVSHILRDNGFAYIEAISDAGDVEGLECMFRAGFLPLLYFPSLKKHGETRRDYVAVGKLFEKQTLRPSALNPRLARFWQEYMRLERA